ncbi:hypothetical protein [Okeania sp. SIO1I7]|uniref:hypothetical protein n=1 Tax=Okeania sp. SIO1I7 TaxID=2607772 RepID=UPI0013FB70D2|nr:hypothetical protein [Okeania sp. SIO1I7]NET25496.1 hypothetical protein [Okeania sp. SIO1I7]
MLKYPFNLVKIRWRSPQIKDIANMEFCYFCLLDWLRVPSYTNIGIGVIQFNQ